jgi:hypothetical protein
VKVVLDASEVVVYVVWDAGDMLVCFERLGGCGWPYKSIARLYMFSKNP